VAIAANKKNPNVIARFIGGPPSVCVKTPGQSEEQPRLWQELRSQNIADNNVPKTPRGPGKVVLAVKSLRRISPAEAFVGGWRKA